MPERIQLRRTKGWRKPADAIVVARPSHYGNHYKVRRNRVIVEHGRFDYSGDRWTVVRLDKWGQQTGTMWGAFVEKLDATRLAVQLHRLALEAHLADLDGEHFREHYLEPLRGHDLACWCPLDQPCHADVLLDLANRGPDA